MKTLIVALIAVLLIPAAATACGPYGAEMFWHREVDALLEGLERAQKAGELTRWERVMVERRLESAERVRRNHRRHRLEAAQAELHRAHVTLKRLATNKYRPSGSRVVVTGAR